VHPDLLHNPNYSPAGLSNTSLHLACILGHLSVVELLVSLGHEAQSMSLNENHQTPLMLAAQKGHAEVVNFLCLSGCAAVERQDIRGRDAVMLASGGGHDTCLQILLTHAPEIPNASAYFPAVQPAMVAWPGDLGGTPAQRALLSHADADGNTALHYASMNGHLLALRTLLAAGADPERRNVWSWTAVSYSSTVQAEVYFRNLIAESMSKRRAREDAMRRGTGTGTGSSVRLVGQDTDETDDSSASYASTREWPTVMTPGGV
jgi:ankyrin repeat protein